MTAPRPTYSTLQLTQYFDRVRLPQKLRQHDISALDPPAALAYLTTLQQHQLAWVPFENLTLHYSTHQHICLHPEDLFRKIVTDDNGRGGYCMENNALFGTVLRSLGFCLYPTGGRVLEGGVWSSLAHMVNLVTIGETKYHVDVGFGADGPIIPMPVDRSGTVQKHISPGSVRLEWRNISESTDPSQRFWVYEYRRNDQSDWNPTYAFTELEFLPQDFLAMSQYISTSPQTFFTHTVVVERKILDKNGELAGTMIMNGKSIKWRIHGQVTQETALDSEQDRLDSLEKHWGIRFGAADRESIRGRVSEIK